MVLIDERQLQRLVDDECTPAERQAILAQLDEHPDGWKTVACAFLEEQRFAAAFASDVINRPLAAASTKTVGTVSPAMPPQQSSAVVPRHWFYHPAMSLALTACIAFMFGILVVSPFKQDPPSSLASPQPSEEQYGDNFATSQFASTGSRLTLRPEGQEPVSIPLVNNLSDFASGIRNLRQPQSAWAQDPAMTQPSSIQVFKIRSGDEVYLVPVNDQSPKFYIH